MTPLVTVVVCTRDRAHGLERALGSVLAQDHPELDVVVVDDGDEPARVPDRVRVVRTGGRGPGAARAAGLEAARGELIAWCDDDDEWDPRHVSVLAGYLEEHPDADLAYADTEGEPSFDYDFFRLAWAGNHIHPSDAMARVTAARAAGGFDPSLRASEDWDLWLRMGRRGAIRHVPVVLGRRGWSRDGIASGDHWEDWHRVFERNATALTEAGPAAEHDLVADAARAAPFDPATWTDGRRELVVLATPLAGAGYGEVARELLPALERAGVTPLMAPTRSQPPAELERFYRPLDHWGRFALYYHVHARPGVLPAERRIAYTMWESTEVPAWRVDELNRATELVYVPCRQNAESFAASGVEVPIRVLHHGVDAGRFPLLDRPDGRPFTFGTYGDLSHRKGLDVLLRAFREEFDSDEPVALIVKSGGQLPPDLARGDPRVRVETGFRDQAALLELLRDMDAFVMPSRGEGFGLCGLEAMATGLPLVATDWSGPAEYVRDTGALPLRHELVDAAGTTVGNSHFFGDWAEPDVGHLRELMRALASDRTAARERGLRCAAAVRARWGWDRPAAQLREDLDALVRVAA